MNPLHPFAPYRPLLYIIAAIGFGGLNGVFLFYGFVHPETMAAALTNPISLVFVLEAFLLMGFLAWLIGKAGFRDPGWKLFVVLSIIGSLAFSVPAFLILRLRKTGSVSNTA
jgi:hypothetical protein